MRFGEWHSMTSHQIKTQSLNVSIDIIEWDHHIYFINIPLERKTSLQRALNLFSVYEIIDVWMRWQVSLGTGNSCCVVGERMGCEGSGRSKICIVVKWNLIHLCLVIFYPLCDVWSVHYTSFNEAKRISVNIIEFNIFQCGIYVGQGGRWGDWERGGWGGGSGWR